jgi:hypothetical protein
LNLGKEKKKSMVSEWEQIQTKSKLKLGIKRENIELTSAYKTAFTKW